jgi:hypothetical protein
MHGYHQYDLLQFAERYGLTDHAFFEISKYFGESDEYWIAGGAVRALLLDQPITTVVDFFFNSQEAYEAFVAMFSTNDNHNVATTEHHHTFKKEVVEGKWYRIQAIKIGYYDTVEECLDSFDFTICQLGIRQGQLYVGQYTMWDLARKRLALHKLTYGAATVRRLLEYTKQGFTACSGCIASILKVVEENPSVINSEIQYVD